MIDPAVKFDVDAAVIDPAEYFTAPTDVLDDLRLTQDDKRRILESWALDAQLLAQAEAENSARVRTGRGSERSSSLCWSCNAGTSRARQVGGTKREPSVAAVAARTPALVKSSVTLLFGAICGIGPELWRIILRASF